MDYLKKGMLTTAVALAFSGAVQAGPVFEPGLNDLEIINRENVYRATAACTPITCLAPNAANDPGGFQRVNTSLPNNVLPGDLFIGLIQVRNISNLTLGDTWSQDNSLPAPFDTFTGYFVNRVHSIAIDFDGSTDRILLEGSTVDPFGVITGAELAAGVSVKTYVDTTTRVILDGAATTTFSSIGSATDGVLWATLGVGATAGTAATPFVDQDGYIYAEVQLGGGLPDFTGDFFEAFNIITEGPGYNAGLLRKINDPAEALFGGAQPGDAATTAADNANGECTAVPIPGPFFLGGYGCYDIPGNGQLSVNQNVSPWQFASEDPLQLFVVPEPGSVALLGLGLAALAGIGRRRRVA